MSPTLSMSFGVSLDPAACPDMLALSTEWFLGKLGFPRGPTPALSWILGKYVLAPFHATQKSQKQQI